MRQYHILIFLNLISLALFSCGPQDTTGRGPIRGGIGNTPTQNNQSGNNTQNNQTNNNTQNNQTNNNTQNNQTNNNTQNNQTNNNSNNIKIEGVPEFCLPEFSEKYACGGDPVGEWVLKETCANQKVVQDLADEFCGTSTGSVDAIGEGQLDVNSNGTYVQTLAGQLDLSFGIPANCQALEVQGGCDSLVETCRDVFGAEDIVCKESGGVCDCDMSLKIIEQNSYEYTIDSENGRLFVNDKEGGRTAEFFYCTDGKELHIRQKPTKDSSMSTNNVEHILVPTQVFVKKK